MGELESAAPDVRVVWCEEGNLGIALEQRSRLRDSLTVYQDLAREDQCACTLARRSETALEDELVEAYLQLARSTIHFPISSSRESATPADASAVSALTRHSARESP